MEQLPGAGQERQSIDACLVCIAMFDVFKPARLDMECWPVLQLLGVNEIRSDVARLNEDKQHSENDGSNCAELMYTEIESDWGEQRHRRLSRGENW